MLTIWFSFLCFTLAAARPQGYDTYSYKKTQSNKRAQSEAAAPLVDLGYSVYQGVANESYQFNVFQGIRYAAPPTGQNRWQAPQSPADNKSAPIAADSWPAQCPQSPRATQSFMPTDNSGNSEDCLFLNVYAPMTVQKSLPVLVWIHGGGYGQGNSQVDFGPILASNDNSFVAVSIQYRLGAFGFMSSEEIFQNGVVNAGLLDQQFALQWVQKYIHLFGGDPSKVTISGESAGAGSVMLLDIAYGGKLGQKLFVNTAASSPYLPMQHAYNDPLPTRFYSNFVDAVGCSSSSSGNNVSAFQCLQAADTEVLISTSATVSQSGLYGTWAFLPVTDGTFLTDLPSHRLYRKKVNGRNVLVGNNANEGNLFVPQNITTEDELVSWIQRTFPLFSENDVAELLQTYPGSDTSDDPNAPLFATSGDSGATAVNQSSVATGNQQRANNIYAETTFVCPSYWLTEAYADNRATDGAGYKYQFSVPAAQHGSDVAALYGDPSKAPPPYSTEFMTAFQQIWGHFVVAGNPSISSVVANGEDTGQTNPASKWPAFTVKQPFQIDLNQTMPVPQGGYSGSVAASMVKNDFKLVNAFTWEGGRGARCDFWRRKAEVVPERK